MRLPRRVPVAGESPEVIAHHVAHHVERHDCPLGSPAYRLCPCRSSLAVCCGGCDTILLAGAVRGSVMCDHLAELLEGVDR